MIVFRLKFVERFAKKTYAATECTAVTVVIKVLRSEIFRLSVVVKI